MAKTPKLKHNPSANPRSRASRLQPPLPSNDPSTSKSLSTSTTLTNPPTLHKAAPNSGISKRPKPKKQSRQQRLRQEKVFARAEDVREKMERKVLVGRRRERVGRERRRGWEEVNGDAVVEGRVEQVGSGIGGVGKEEKGEEMEVEDEDEWVDEDDGVGGVGQEDRDEEAEGPAMEAKVVDLEALGEVDGLENEEDKIT